MEIGFYVGLNNTRKVFISGRLLPLNLTVTTDKSQIKGIRFVKRIV